MSEAKISSSIFDSRRNRTILVLALVLATSLIYYFSNPRPASYSGYTFRVDPKCLAYGISFPHNW